MAKDKAKVRNSSIDMFRYLCAIMVVAIHTHPFSDINDEIGYIFTQILPRIGVPYFFAVAGYYYIQKLEKGQKPFLPYFKRLLTTYFIWSILYYIVGFIRGEYQTFQDIIVKCLYPFVVTGSYYHFWFFPALIFAVCLTTFLFKIKCSKVLIPLSLVLYVIGCLGCSYYELGVKIPVLGHIFLSSWITIIRRVLFMGYPFFISGYLVYKVKDKAEKFLTNELMCIGVGISCIIWLAEIYLVRTLKWETNIFVTFGLYLLVITTLLILIRNPLPQYRLLSNKCKVLANFTYYSHPLCILCLSTISSIFCHTSITATAMFFLTVILTFIVGICIYKLDNKFINKLID